MVYYIMENYENHLHNLAEYRKTVYQLEENFMKRIQEIFIQAEE